MLSENIPHRAITSFSKTALQNDVKNSVYFLRVILGVFCRRRVQFRNRVFTKSHK